MRKLAAVLIFAAMLCGCVQDTTPTEPTATQPPAVTSQVPTAETAAIEVQPQEVLVLEQSEPVVQFRATVEAPGTAVKQGGGIVIDYSNQEKGYVMVRCQEDTAQRLKVRIAGTTTTYTYNLPALQWTAFPLSDENGTYQITVYRNVTGSKYAAVLSLTLEVTLEDPFGPFLRSNQYVNFDIAPKTVAKAAALTVDKQDTLEKVAAIYDYVIHNLTYDKEQAAAVKSGYLPELDSVLERKTGICFDYAALLTGMLRSQGIPAKLVVGYAGTVYHAWISVWSETTGWVDGVIFFDGTSWKRMDPTFASSGESSREIMAYIGDGTNYTAKYFY